MKSLNYRLYIVSTFLCPCEAMTCIKLMIKYIYMKFAYIYTSCIFSESLEYVMFVYVVCVLYVSYMDMDIDVVVGFYSKSIIRTASCTYSFIKVHTYHIDIANSINYSWPSKPSFSNESSGFLKNNWQAIAIR